MKFFFNDIRNVRCFKYMKIVLLPNWFYCNESFVNVCYVPTLLPDM